MLQFYARAHSTTTSCEGFASRRMPPRLRSASSYSTRNVDLRHAIPVASQTTCSRRASVSDPGTRIGKGLV